MKNNIIGTCLSRAEKQALRGGILVSAEITSCRITDANGNVSVVANCNCAIVLVPEGSTCKTIGLFGQLQMQATDMQQAQSTML